MNEWAPLFRVATRDLDADGPAIRSIFDKLCHNARCDKSKYKLDSEAQFAMGWWFFTIHVQEEFFKKTAEYIQVLNPRITGERGILEYVQLELKRTSSNSSSKAVIKLDSKRSLFTRYWTWLLR